MKEYPHRKNLNFILVKIPARTILKSQYGLNLSQKWLIQFSKPWIGLLTPFDEKIGYDVMKKFSTQLEIVSNDFLQILTMLVEKYTLYFRICNFFFVQIKHLEPSFTNSVFRFRDFVSYSGLIAIVLPRVICRHESNQGGFSLDWAHTACFKNHSIAFL